MNKKAKNKALPSPKQGEVRRIPRQGQIWLVEFPKVKESRKPTRPCLVISDNVQNECDEWIVVIPLTTEDIENIQSLKNSVRTFNKVLLNLLKSILKTPRNPV